ncbi:hypothetical protein ACHAWF_012974 [Thalassiosira exigua]
MTGRPFNRIRIPVHRWCDCDGRTDNFQPLFQTMAPLQAYFLGVLTCVVVYLACSFLFPSHSVAVAPSRRRRGSRRRASPRKRGDRSIRALRSQATESIETDSSSHSPDRTNEYPLADDKVYRGLARRIRQRSATRSVRKTNRIIENAAGGARNESFQRSRHNIGSRRHGDPTKLLSRVVHHHPIARNRALYDGRLSTTNAIKKPSKDLLDHMNSHPLRTIQKSLDSVKQTNRRGSVEDTSHSDKRTLPRRKASAPGKENELLPVSNDDAGNVTFDLSSASGRAGSVADSSSRCPDQKASITNREDTNINANDLNKPHPLEQLDASPPEDVSEELLVRDHEGRGKCAPVTCSGDKQNETNTNDHAAPKQTLTALVSNGVHDYAQAANQKAALNLLNDLCISYSVVDGMDLSQKDRRDELFAISGIRGNYPQFFSSTDGGDRYLGNYDWLNGLQIEDLKATLHNQGLSALALHNQGLSAAAEMIGPLPNAGDDRGDHTRPHGPDVLTLGETGPSAKARLTVLISKGVHNYTQAANQKAALNLLNDLCISYSVVDGMDPSQRDRRDELFAISGIRGNYPQIFSSTEAGNSYLGSYDWLNALQIEVLEKLARKD